jgi:hypothetical protein
MKRGDVWWINFEPAVGGEVRTREHPFGTHRAKPTRWHTGQLGHFWRGIISVGCDDATSLASISYEVARFEGHFFRKSGQVVIINSLNLQLASG